MTWHPFNLWVSIPWSLLLLTFFQTLIEMFYKIPLGIRLFCIRSRDFIRVLRKGILKWGCNEEQLAGARPDLPAEPTLPPNNRVKSQSSACFPACCWTKIPADYCRMAWWGVEAEGDWNWIPNWEALAVFLRPRWGKLKGRALLLFPWSWQVHCEIDCTWVFQKSRRKEKEVAILSPQVLNV